MKWLSVALSLLIVSHSLADTCMPAYWQVDPSYRVPLDEALQYAHEGIAPNNISESFTEKTIKYTYELTNIKGSAQYDGAARDVKINANVITVNNSVLSVNFTYNASKSESTFSKGYKGYGNATMNNIKINSTKQLTINAGKATYSLVSLKTSIPTAISVNPFEPVPNDVTNSTLYGLVTKNLVQQINSTIVGTIEDAYKQLLQDQQIQNTFDSVSYSYVYNGFAIKFDSGISNVSIFGPVGIVKGYSMKIVNGPSKCPQFVPPTDEKASFMTIEMLQSVYEHNAQSNPAWSSMRFDQTNMMSDLFQFYLVDLESIVPEALNRYPNLLAKLYAKCTPAANYSLTIDPTYSLIRLRNNWNCTLFMQENDVPLLAVSVPLNNEVRVSAVGSSLRTVISAVTLSGDASWQEMEGLPIVNQKLATAYLKSLIGSLAGKTTLGTGFPLFTSKCSMEFNKDYIKFKQLSLAPL